MTSASARTRGRKCATNTAAAEQPGTRPVSTLDRAAIGVTQDYDKLGARHVGGVFEAARDILVYEVATKRGDCDMQADVSAAERLSGTNIAV